MRSNDFCKQMELLLNGLAIKMRFIKVISEDFHNSDAASTVEEELEVMTVKGGVGICDGSSGAKRFGGRTRGMDLVRDFNSCLQWVENLGVSL